MEDKNRKTTIIAMIGVIAIVVLYLVGLAVQYFEGPTINDNGWGYTQVSISFNPFVCIVKTLTTAIGY